MKICASKSYGSKTVFENFALDIKDGEILCVLGRSGSGKTTLLNILAGLTEFSGQTEGVPERVGYIFQEPRLLPNLTVAENLAYIGAANAEIDEILRKTELLGLKDKRPKELSGGEKQRVSIARAFLSDAPLLLLDEPFSSLDTALKIRLSRVFAELWQEKKRTAVFVTHDIEEAWMLAHRIVMIEDGEISAEFRLDDSALPREYGAGAELKRKVISEMLKK
ncbi:MAG: ABC transporter ATP-binding protein [Clostridia bacterium]|nr:ABC transporter ATP-binding protein [Clostridia bacterium]